MKQRFKVQNFYKTTTQSIIPAGDPTDTTEYSFVVAEAPIKAPVYVVVDFTDETKRDIIYVHKIDGNTLYYYNYNRTKPNVEHAAWSSCQINDVAEFFNYLFENVDDFGKVKKKTGLDVIVYGGKIKVNNQDVEINDTEITLADNTTNYIVFDYTDNKIKALTDLTWFTWILLAEIITSGGQITKIVDKRQVQLNYIIDENKLEIVSGRLSVKDWVIEPKSHTHTASDITNFDTAVSNNADVAANTAARHTHSNKSALDKIKDDGSGNKFLADDWTYKEVITTDEKVKTSSSDASAGYLQDKIIAGTNITIEKVTETDWTEKLKINSIGSGGGSGGGASTFLGLTDTPNSYVGNWNKVVAVKADESGLEFIDIPSGGSWDTKTVKTTSDDTKDDYLENKIIAGDNIGIDVIDTAYWKALGIRVIKWPWSWLDADTLDWKEASDFADASHSHNLWDLNDVDTTWATNWQVLKYDGSQWRPENIEWGKDIDTKKYLWFSTWNGGSKQVIQTWWSSKVPEHTHTKADITDFNENDYVHTSWDETIDWVKTFNQAPKLINITQDDTQNQILVRDAGTNEIKWRDAATLVWSWSGQITYDAIVAADGSWDYTTLSAAIADGKKYIYIKPGTYNEIIDDSSKVDFVQSHIYITAHPLAEYNYVLRFNNSWYVYKNTSADWLKTFIINWWIWNFHFQLASSQTVKFIDSNVSLQRSASLWIYNSHLYFWQENDKYTDFHLFWFFSTDEATLGLYNCVIKWDYTWDYSTAYNLYLGKLFWCVWEIYASNWDVFGEVSIQWGSGNNLIVKERWWNKWVVLSLRNVSNSIIGWSAKTYLYWTISWCEINIYLPSPDYYIDNNYSVFRISGDVINSKLFVNNAGLWWYEFYWNQRIVGNKIEWWKKITFKNWKYIFTNNEVNFPIISWEYQIDFDWEEYIVEGNKVKANDSASYNPRTLTINLNWDKYTFQGNIIMNHWSSPVINQSWTTYLVKDNLVFNY